MRRRLVSLATTGLLVAATAGCQRRAADAAPPTTLPVVPRVDAPADRHAPTGLLFPETLANMSRSDLKRDGDAISASYARLSDFPTVVTLRVYPARPARDLAEAFEAAKLEFALSDPTSRAVGGGASADLLVGQAVGETARVALYRTADPAASSGESGVLLAVSELAPRDGAEGQYLVQVRATYPVLGDEGEAATRTEVRDWLRAWRETNGLAVPSAANRPGA